MTDERQRTLDDEGVPDLEGPLPQKEATGDPQEGLPPPNDAPGPSTDRRVTPVEEQRSDTVGERVEREQPDLGEAAPAAGPPEQVQMADPQGTRDDVEKEVVAEETTVDGALDPEEEAMRVEPDQEEER